jgi:hypothetical protein
VRSPNSTFLHPSLARHLTIPSHSARRDRIAGGGPDAVADVALLVVVDVAVAVDESPQELVVLQVAG